ncbi:hypothetical protein JZO73_11385 [Enterococcus plantarum]|uniref:hypothetical protein n=1 Tax=Enterococcus plantarum TaxID=1077675 RepID=UPI001A9017D0|nr:hypothetical protein [Enterococcus plantarum]MBO0468129.1 hypothetical protein [Enterococcus plantarum]
MEKLHTFSSQTNGLFSNSLNDMKVAMQNCLILENTVVNSDGSYSLPEGVDKSWFNQLKKASDLNGITGDKQPDVGNREYKLIDLGYGKIWLWVEKGKTTATSEDITVSLAYNEWLSRMIAKHGLGFVQGDRGKGMDELFYEQNATLIKELSTGIDSVTGKKLTTAEKLGKASLLANGLITMGVMVKGVVKISTPKNNLPNKNTVIQGSKNGKNYTLDKSKSNGNKSYKKPPKLDYTKNNFSNIPKMSKSDILNSIPKDWSYTENNGFVHVRDSNGQVRMKIDPPDKVTKYDHVHLFDKDGNVINKNGQIVGRKSSEAHIPYKK